MWPICFFRDSSVDVNPKIFFFSFFSYMAFERNIVWSYTVGNEVSVSRVTKCGSCCVVGLVVWLCDVGRYVGHQVGRHVPGQTHDGVEHGHLEEQGYLLQSDLTDLLPERRLPGVQL